MSQFLTPIPIDLADIKALLPAESFIESVRWNATDSRIEIIWSNRNLRTKWSIPTEFPLDSLRGKTVPNGIEISPVKIAVPQPASAPEPEAVKISRETKVVNDNEKPVAKRKKGSIKPVNE